MKLLVVEDEKEISNAIRDYFAGEDFLCDVAYNYLEAERKMYVNEYVCIVLDLNLPGGNGLTLLEKLKDEGKGDGVIIISARGSISDKITGLQKGADDYLAKPFHLAELGARVASVIRRRSFDGLNQMVLDNLVLDVFKKTLTFKGQPILLTRKEFDLFLYFVSNKNRVVTKEAIVEHIWNSDIELADSYDFIYAHIKNLRKKLAQAGCKDYIKVAYGIGYRFSTH